MDKYAGRSLRYLVKVILILAVAFLLMHLTGTLAVNGNILETIFLTRRGQILIVLLLALAAVYPKLAFGTVAVPGDRAEERDAIINAFSSLDYVLTYEDEDRLEFRARSIPRRLTMQWDDKVTVTGQGRNIAMEGLKKMVLRAQTRLKTFQL